MKAICGIAGCLALALGMAAVAGESSHAASQAQIKQRTIDALFSRFDQPGSPGLALGIYQTGKPVYARGFGLADLEHRVPITPQTIFHVASVSKQFTAFAIALLAREGKVDLHADIRTYLPYVPDLGQRITVSDLIHHTSGLRDQWDLFRFAAHGLDDTLQQKQVIAMVAHQRALNFEPGMESLYSNTNYTLLAEIVRAVSDRTLRQFTSERMFRPLGMTRTLFLDDPREILAGRAPSYERNVADSRWERSLLNFDIVGATSLNTSIEDMAKWAANLARPTVGDRALIAQVSAPGKLRDGSSINYGFGLGRQIFAGHEALIHNGSDAGYRAVFAYFPKEDFLVSILTNTPFDRLNHSIAVIADIYLNGGTGAAPAGIPTAIVPDPALLAALEGHYLSPFGQMAVLRLEGATLLWQVPGRSGSAITFRDDGTFDYDRREWRYYRARRDDRGGVIAIEELNARNRQAVLMQRVDPVKPSAAALAELAGEYRLPELETNYTFTVEGGALVARTLWSTGAVTFTPSVADRFDTSSGFWNSSTIIVRRNKRGQPSGFDLQGGRVRHVTFEKKADSRD